MIRNGYGRVLPHMRFMLYDHTVFADNAQMMADETNENPAREAGTGEVSGAAPAREDFESLLADVGRHKNRQSFITLFRHFAPRVKSFLMRSGASEAQADELAQETMLNVWNKAEGYDPAKSAASTWIFTIARNKRIDAMRKSKFYSVDLDSLPEIEDANHVSPAQGVADKQEIAAIAAALEALPPEQAALIKQSFFENKTHQEIAEETGIPLGTIKSRIRLALRRLRQTPTVSELWP